MPRSHIKREELDAVALRISALIGAPWLSPTTPAVRSVFIEPMNDYFFLSQATSEDGDSRILLGPTHRGGLLRQMEALIVGIELAQPIDHEAGK